MIGLCVVSAVALSADTTWQSSVSTETFFQILGVPGIIAATFTWLGTKFLETNRTLQSLNTEITRLCELLRQNNENITTTFTWLGTKLVDTSKSHQDLNVETLRLCELMRENTEKVTNMELQQYGRRRYRRATTEEVK